MKYINSFAKNRRQNVNKRERWREGVKLTLLFLIAFSLNMSANTYSEQTLLSLNIENKSIKDVLFQIESMSEFRFIYENEKINLDKKISIKTENQSIQSILKEVFEKENVDYEITENNFILINPKNKVIRIHSQNALQQQKRKITGVITDKEGFPLPGANVVEEGTTNGIITDLEGNFSLEVSDNAVLQISYIGYTTRKIAVNNQNSFAITLSEDLQALEEVVVVGYGTQRKSDLTGAIYSVKTEKLEDLPNTNIIQGLQGSVPGLNITNTESDPGAAPELRIRGENSLSASNNPLIILDGIPFEENINDINPGDIESVNVLKDASSAAIYGARAANGVIIITTKKGKKGKVQVNYRGYYGIQTVENKIDLLNGSKYIKFLQDYNRFVGKTDLTPEALLMTDELAQYNAGSEVDWQDMVFRVASQQNHQLSFSGGSDKTSYYTSLGFLDQRGIVENSGMTRYTLRSNIDHKISNWLKLGANIQLTNKDLGGNQPDITNAIKISPYGKVKDENGRYTHYPQSPQQYYSNPFADNGATVDDVTKRAFANIFSEITIPFIKGLSYRLNFGIDYNNREYGDYYPSYTLTGKQPNGLANIENYSQVRLTWENIITYNKDFDNHHVDLTGLYSRESDTNKESKIEGKGFVNDDNLYHYIESAEQKDIESKLTESELVSYMGRINYNFRHKYFFTATGRIDGYSGFGRNNKYGFFPSIALGWVPTQENFMQEFDGLSFVNYLKFRVSLGENGNMGISPYQTLDSFTGINYVYGDNQTTANGLIISKVGNPDLKWESTITLNLGVDYALFDNRISGNIEFYKSQSKNLLMTRQLPVMNGYTSIWYNVGKTENKGFEFNLNTVNIENDDFRWTTNLNFSLNHDKIVALRGDGKDDLANSWFIGQPLRVYYDYNMIGIWQTTDDIANSHMPTAKPGTPIIKDVTKDGKITGDDREIIGSKLPDWIGGITNTFSYKNWSLSAFINTVQGIDKENNLLNPGAWLPAKNTNYLDIPYWTEENPSNTYVAPGYDENALQHKFYQDASYVRIKDVSLAYTFPQKIIEEFGIANLKLYISGKNLYTFTNWDGYDPEADKSFDPYPNSRTIVMGVNLGF